MNAKRSNKTPVGFPLEARFNDNGYTLLWDSRIRMSAVEYAFFCNYIDDRNTALLYFGSVSSQALTRVSPSLHLLHSMSADFMRTAALSNSIDELKNAVDDKLKSLLSKFPASTKISAEALKSIYSGMISVLLKSNEAVFSKSIERIYLKSAAASTVSFAIEETANAEQPFLLHIFCRFAGKDTDINTAAQALGGDDTLLFISAPLRRLSLKSSLVKRIYNNGNILSSLYLSLNEMHIFLRELEVYSSCGIICKVPNRWKRRKSSLAIGMVPAARNTHLGADAILNLDIKLTIDGEALTDEEIHELINSNDNLFLFRGKWIELKRNEMRSCLAAYEKLISHSDGISLSDAMSLFLSPDAYTSIDDDFVLPELDISIDQLQTEIKKRNDTELYDVTQPSEEFTAVLRPYQADGVRWLNFMRSVGLGACLSDDMGLGKTIQAIAILVQLRHSESGQSLIVIPASLLQNWQSELAKFAPKLKVKVLHNSFGSMNITPDTDVFITTYAMVQRLPMLKTMLWDCVILDEAQAIKNPRTLQSKACKMLKSKFRIAMTGTPIENSITDLWSIFNFLNPQLFRAAYDLMVSLVTADNETDRLKNFVKPFILRRLKTDKSIISDLPEKIEMKSYCMLTQRQALLYTQVVHSLRDDIASVQGAERRGLVLAGITRLKQICNHPDQYTGNGIYLTADSGKFARLAELCEEIKARHERVLVFTQFKELCEPLSNMLEGIFGIHGLTIHGSTGVNERGSIVASFNDPNQYIPYIVLSLRAGGVGLNLTAANHVIHFDRWWNPAVENQATDRAFRIGQKNNVIVHKLICTGTLEEKIDKLLEQKSDMATEIVSSDIKLTELSNEDLLKLLNMD